MAKRNLGALFALVVCFPAAGLHAQGEMPWVWFYNLPSIPVNENCQPPFLQGAQKLIWPIGCYCVTHGRFENCYVEFKETFSLEGVPAEERIIWTGGHEHERPGPGAGAAFDASIGAFTCPLDENGGADKSRFFGYTANKEWVALKQIPQASGIIRLSGRYRISDSNHEWIPSYTWKLDPNDEDYVYTEIGLVTWVAGLEPLPDVPGLYAKISNPGKHTPGQQFYSNGLMHLKLMELASRYQAWYEQTNHIKVALSFNDLSLPLGGLFDIEGFWFPPHDCHRVGLSVDVNRCAPVLGQNADQFTCTVDEKVSKGYVRVSKKDLDEMAKEINLKELHTTAGDTRMHYELQIMEEK